ncbi:MAG: hypothetical protein QXU99_08235 [Candidatus Bathyarchaeia archaeon]
MSKLHELYANSAIEHFGTALRIAIGKRDYGGCEDYASLVELDYVEKEEQFIIVLKKFLRRFDACARRWEREHPGRSSFKPSEKDLDEVVKLAQEYGVRVVCAAIMSHALVYSEKGEKGQ